MLKLFIRLQIWLVDDDHNDRGSVTTEHVLWAVAVIAIAGIVVAAVKAYVTTQTGNLK